MSRHRRNQQESCLPWKPVSVELPSSSSTSHSNNNNDTEPMAMFVGLEVLDGRQFQVNNNHTKIRKLMSEKESSSTEPGTEPTTFNRSKRGKKEASASDKDDASKEKEGPTTSSTADSDKDATVNKKKKKKNKRKRASKQGTAKDRCMELNTTEATPTASTSKRKKKEAPPTATADKDESATSVRSKGDAKDENLNPNTDADSNENKKSPTESTDAESYPTALSAKKKKKRKRRSSSNTQESDGSMAPKDASCTSAALETTNNNASSKKKKQQRKTGTDDNAAVGDSTTEPSEQDLLNVQQSWMVATGGVLLPEKLCAALHSQNFQKPTPIQASTLAAATLGRRNVVGAAPTGSGKTLAFLLPMAMRFLQQDSTDLLLRALILTPTRELALQISQEYNKLHLPNFKSGVLVGGMDLHKQERILTKVKPALLVATPGRLWDLMSSERYEHLQDLTRLEFLVIDEADRMVLHRKSFPQLHSILREVNARSGGTEDDDEEEVESVNDEEEERLLGLPGIRGEAQVQMLTPELLQQLNENNAVPEPVELEDEEFEQLQQEQQQENDDEEDENLFQNVAPPVQRQTFIFSATLTLPPSESYKTKKKKPNKKQSVEGGIAEILQVARAKGPTKIVDLTSTSKTGAMSNKNKNNARLPPGLSLRVIHCTQRHKDSHLYAYLVTTAQGASGPCLVFCNSIAAVRRVGATLSTLKLPVRMLHAQMAQKARFRAVESLKEPKSRAIVVATDVAARGLDIPSVATVVHYDVARAPDTFIHRAGRTARGMGEGAVGSSLSLVAPAEAKMHDKICKALAGDQDNVSRNLWEPVMMDGRLVSSAQERVALVSKIVACEELESKTQKHNSWLEQAASDAGLDLDDELKEEGLAGGTERERQQLQQAQQAKGKLRQLLSMPMQTQRYGKFLSSNSAALQAEAKPYVVHDSQPKRKRRRKK